MGENTEHCLDFDPEDVVEANAMFPHKECQTSQRGAMHRLESTPFRQGTAAAMLRTEYSTATLQTWHLLMTKSFLAKAAEIAKYKMHYDEVSQHIYS